MFQKIAVFFALSIMIATSVIAQDSIDQLLWGDDIFVITASKRQEHVGDAPATVIVITEEMITQRGYRDLKDVFNDLPGFDISTNVYGEFSTLITQRGMGGNNKIVILLNGVRITSPSGRQFQFGNNVPVYNLKKIEIVYGPASALYGADAFAVINMISKNADDDSEIFADFRAGQAGTYDVYLNVNQKLNDDLAITGFVRKFNSDGQDLADQYDELSSEELGIKPYGYHTPKDDLNIFLNLKIKDLDFSFHSSWYHEQLSTGLVPNHYVYSDQAFWGHSLWQLAVRHNYTSEKLAIKTDAIYSKYEIDPEMNWHYVFPDRSELTVHQYGMMTKFYLESQFDYDLSEKANLIGGVSFAKVMGMPTGDHTDPEPFDRNGPIMLNNFYNDTYPQVAIQSVDDAFYLQLRYDLLEQLHVVGGVRWDRNSVYGQTVNPRTGIVFRSDQTSLKLMAGRAYIAPGYFQRYESWFATEYGHIQNLDLKPEKLQTVEANWIQNFGDRLKTSLSFYRNDVDDLIVKKGFGMIEMTKEWIARGGGWVDANGDGVVFVQSYTNSGGLNAYGADLTLNYVLDQPSINIFGAYSFMGGENVDPETGKWVDLFKTSAHKISGGATLTLFDKISITPRFRFVSDIATRLENSKYGVDRDGDFVPESEHERMPGHSFFTLTIVGRDLLQIDSLEDPSQRLSLYLHIDNLLNQKYYTSGVATEGSHTYLPQVPQDLRSISAGINYQF